MALQGCSGRLRKSRKIHTGVGVRGGVPLASDTSHLGCICTLPASESKITPELDKALYSQPRLSTGVREGGPVPRDGNLPRSRACWHLSSAASGCCWRCRLRAWPTSLHTRPSSGKHFSSRLLSTTLTRHACGRAGPGSTQRLHTVSPHGRVTGSWSSRWQRGQQSRSQGSAGAKAAGSPLGVPGTQPGFPASNLPPLWPRARTRPPASSTGPRAAQRRGTRPELQGAGRRGPSRPPAEGTGCARAASPRPSRSVGARRPSRTRLHERTRLPSLFAWPEALHGRSQDMGAAAAEPARGS